MQNARTPRARDLLAQLVERWNFNPTVKGSSTLWGEIFDYEPKYLNL